MDEREREQTLEDLAKINKKIPRFRFGMVFFAMAYMAAALIFAYIYYLNGRMESLAMAVVMVALTLASVHGYRQRLVQLRAEKESLEDKIAGT